MPDPLDLIADGLRSERAGALDRALDSYARAAELADDSETRAEALTHLADAHRGRAEWDQAIAAARRAHDVACAAGLPDRIADATIAEANAWMCRGDFAVATPLFERVLREHAHARLRGIALQNIGSMQAQRGMLQDAEVSFGEGLACFEAAGYERGMAMALNNLGRVALDRGAPEAAIDLLDRSLGIAREIEDHELCALALLNQAAAQLAAGDAEEAGDLATAALGYFMAAGNRWREIECLKLMGEIEERRLDRVSAARCYERGRGIAEAIGARVEGMALTAALDRVLG